MFRWQQLAVVVGILIGAVGRWYFVTHGPETEAAKYVLFLKHGDGAKSGTDPADLENAQKN